MRKVAILMIMIGAVGMVSTAKGFFWKETIQEEANFSSASFEHISIKGHYGNVTVQPSENQDIKVSWQGTLSNQRSLKKLVTIEESNAELKINIGHQKWFNFSIFNLNMLNKLDVVVELPPKIFKTVVVKNDVGNTLIKQINVDNLTAETDVAKMTIEDVVTKATVAETDVGKLTFKNVEGILHAESDVGNINVYNEHISHDMTLISDVGKIDFTIPEIPDNVTFDAHSSVGKVTVFGEKGSYITANSAYLVSLATDVGKITVKTDK